MSKVIKIKEINSVKGKPYLLPKFDADGNVIWKDSDEKIPIAERTPDMVNADTISIITHIVSNIPRSIQSPKDSYYAYRMFALLSDSHERAQLEFKEKDEELYDWLHRLLKGRKMPFTKEDKDAGVPEHTYGQYLFGLSDFTIRAQLTDIDSPTGEE